MMNKYETVAQTLAEKYGIVEYELKGSRMMYQEKAFNGNEWVTYTHMIQLNGKKEN